MADAPPRAAELVSQLLGVTSEDIGRQIAGAAPPPGATSSGPIVRTSQIALPQETCQTVYATDGYSASVRNLASVSLVRENVFGNDGGIHQIATMPGDTASGYTAALTIGV